MKKTLLLSLAASTAMMAGGDIAPVQPAVEAPAVAKKSTGNVTVDKVSGNAKLWYETKGAGTDSLFNQASSFGNAAASLKVEGKAGALGYGVKYTTTDTLGLEQDIVSDERMPAGDAHWAEEAYVTYGIGNTTLKLGRQHLNTPFAFTENWAVTSNSFNAMVAVNNDFEGVTLVAAHVGSGNGENGSARTAKGDDFSTDIDANMLAFHTTVNGVKVNGYHYELGNSEDANWIDATATIGGAKITAIAGSLKEADVTALSASTKVAGMTVSAAYSDVTGTGHVANVATSGKKSKLPTMGVYTDGLFVGEAGTEAYKIKAVTKVGGVKLIAQYVDSDSATTSNQAEEFDIIAVTKVAGLDVKAIYIDQDYDVSSERQNVRIITSYKF